MLNQLMADAGRLINIAPHKVGPNAIEVCYFFTFLFKILILFIKIKQLHSVADIEGHAGLDGRFYVLDFARTAPPQV